MQGKLRSALEGAADAAAREVSAARDEIAAHDAAEAKRIVSGIASAQAALDRTPLQQSPSAFADRIGVSPWAWDLFLAALCSLGLNGLGAVFIAYGAHGHPPSPSARRAPTWCRCQRRMCIARFMVDRESG